MRDYDPVAKNPPAGTRIYRGAVGEGPDSMGIHWTLDKHMAITRNDPNSKVHEAIIDDPEGQVIPWGKTGTSIRFSPSTGTLEKHPQRFVQGMPSEKEVRLRPGAKVRLASGEQADIKARGGKQYINYGDAPDTIHSYLNLHQYAVRGTPEHRRLENLHYSLPHSQPSMLEEVTDRATNRAIAYNASYDAYPTDSDETWDAYLNRGTQMVDSHYEKTKLFPIANRMPDVPLKDLNAKSHMDSPQFKTEVPGQRSLF